MVNNQSNITDQKEFLKNGCVTLLVGRPGIGKTTTALHLARIVANSGYKVIYLSLEIGTTTLQKRLRVADKTPLPANLIIADPIEVPLKDDLGKINTTAEMLKWVDDICTKTDGLGLLVIDYMQLFCSKPRIMATLKALAQKYDCAVLALAQLSYQVPHRDKRPLLQEIDPVFTIDTDYIIGLYRDSYYTSQNKNIYDDLEFLWL